MGGYKDPPRNDLNMWRRALSDLLVLFDQSVTNGNHAMSARGDIGFMRDDDDRIAFTVQALEEIHDFHAGVRVERASGFIGKQDRRMVNQRPGDGDALALSSRQFIGPMRNAICEIDCLERLR